MHLICPECKNEVDLARYPSLAKGQIIECNSCGITLIVNSTDGPVADVDIVEEGK